MLTYGENNQQIDFFKWVRPTSRIEPYQDLSSIVMKIMPAGHMYRHFAWPTIGSTR